MRNNSKEKNSESLLAALPSLESQLDSLDDFTRHSLFDDIERQAEAMRKKYAQLTKNTHASSLKKIKKHKAKVAPHEEEEENILDSNDIRALRRESKFLHDKKQALLEEYRKLEGHKQVLDAKERIIFQELKSMHDPQVLRVLSAIEQKFSDLAQEREFVAQIEAEHKQRNQALVDKETRIHAMQHEILSRKKKIDAEVLQLQATVSDLKSQRDTLEEQRLHLDAVVRERSQLISDLDSQYHETKSELKKIQQQVESERKLLGSTRQMVEDDEREITLARKEFEGQKKEFYDKISKMSSESQKEVDAYKTKVLEELQEQADELRDREKEVNVKERMLSKLDSEIHKREVRLSKDLSSLEHEREVLDTREVLPPNKPLTPDMYSLDLQRIMNDLHMAIVEGDLDAAKRLYTTAYALYNTAPADVKRKFEKPLKELYYRFN